MSLFDWFLVVMGLVFVWSFTKHESDGNLVRSFVVAMVVVALVVKLFGAIIRWMF